MSSADIFSGEASEAAMQAKIAMHKRLKEIVKPDDATSWDLAWKENVTPWEAGAVQPSLREVIEESGIAFPTTGRGLVPGCGSGYDVFYLAERGLDATGMDISETGIASANAARSKESQDVISRTNFLVTDFFTYTVPEDQKFDLVIDHTFFVAIPPSLRPAWGEQMAKLTKPGGYLVCIVFPIQPKVDVGPPYYVRPEHYEDVLGGSFTKVWDEVPTKSSASHEGKERVLVWKRNS